jgi:hypothetical protein
MDDNPDFLPAMDDNPDFLPAMDDERYSVFAARTSFFNLWELITFWVLRL